MSIAFTLGLALLAANPTGLADGWSVRYLQPDSSILVVANPDAQAAVLFAVKRTPKPEGPPSGTERSELVYVDLRTQKEVARIPLPSQNPGEFVSCAISATGADVMCLVEDPKQFRWGQCLVHWKPFEQPSELTCASWPWEKKNPDGSRELFALNAASALAISLDGQKVVYFATRTHFPAEDNATDDNLTDDNVTVEDQPVIVAARLDGTETQWVPTGVALPDTGRHWDLTWNRDSTGVWALLHGDYVDLERRPTAGGGGEGRSRLPERTVYRWDLQEGSLDRVGLAPEKIMGITSDGMLVHPTTKGDRLIRSDWDDFGKRPGGYALVQPSEFSEHGTAESPGQEPETAPKDLVRVTKGADSGVQLVKVFMGVSRVYALVHRDTKDTKRGYCYELVEKGGGMPHK